MHFNFITPQTYLYVYQLMASPRCPASYRMQLELALQEDDIESLDRLIDELEARTR